MPNLYASWIELPVSDLDRAKAFYQAVFDLVDTPFYDEAPAKIILLAPSDKSVQKPGVSLVQSPIHHPYNGGAVINFHIGTHNALETAMNKVSQFGGTVDTEIVDTGDGVKYINVLDSEGNRIALSSYEEADENA
jgi:uncharacterized protein